MVTSDAGRGRLASLCGGAGRGHDRCRWALHDHRLCRAAEGNGAPVQDPESVSFSACRSVQAPGNQPQGGERLRARGRHGLWGGCEEPLPGTSTPVPSAQASQLCRKRAAQRVSLRHQRLRAESGLRRADSGRGLPSRPHTQHSLGLKSWRNLPDPPWRDPVRAHSGLRVLTWGTSVLLMRCGKG